MRQGSSHVSGGQSRGGEGEAGQGQRGGLLSHVVRPDSNVTTEGLGFPSAMTLVFNWRMSSAMKHMDIRI